MLPHDARLSDARRRTHNVPFLLHNRVDRLTFLFMYVTISDTGPKEASSIPKSNPPEALGFTCQATSSQGIMALAPALSPTENISLRNWGRGMGYVSCRQTRLNSTMVA